MPVINTRSPGWRRPADSASPSASGIDPDDVLPYRSTLTTVRSSGMPSFLRAWSMIRTFAWCGTYRSTSATGTPDWSSTFSAESTSTRVANLNTSRPFIFAKCWRSATVSAEAGAREPPAGM